MYHQSGLPRELTNNSDYDNLSLSKIVELAKLEKLQFEPGTQTLYSNGLFSVALYHWQTSGNGYPAFIRMKFFRKMNLNNTLEFNSTKSVPNLLMVLKTKMEKVVPTSKESINKYETGNFLSTIDDLYSFSRQVLSGEALKKSLAVKLFRTWQYSRSGRRKTGIQIIFYMNLKLKLHSYLFQIILTFPYRKQQPTLSAYLKTNPMKSLIK